MAKRPNVWTRKLEQAKEEGRKEGLRQAAARQLAEDFAKRVGESIMMMLAMTPPKDWPDVAKRALEHETRLAPTAAYVYLETFKSAP